MLYLGILYFEHHEVFQNLVLLAQDPIELLLFFHIPHQFLLGQDVVEIVDAKRVLDLDKIGFVLGNELFVLAPVKFLHCRRLLVKEHLKHLVNMTFRVFPWKLDLGGSTPLLPLNLFLICFCWFFSLYVYRLDFVYSLIIQVRFTFLLVEIEGELRMEDPLAKLAPGVLNQTVILLGQF